MPAQRRLDIFQMRSCAVQSSIATESQGAVLDFLVAVNSVRLKCLWHHHSSGTFLPLYLFHTPASLPSVSFYKAPGVCLFLTPVVSLCSSTLYHLYDPKSFTVTKLNISPPSFFLLSLSFFFFFFWVKCKMKYSRTSQGCTSNGFYGNCRGCI